MIKERITGRLSECIVAFDPSYIGKSGKEKHGLGMYWSGCAGRAKWGLDICGFAVVDVILNTAFAVFDKISCRFHLLNRKPMLNCIVPSPSAVLSGIVSFVVIPSFVCL